MTKMTVKINVKFVPLPAEKKAAWDNSMRLLGEMLLEILAEDDQSASDDTRLIHLPNDRQVGT